MDERETSDREILTTLKYISFNFRDIHSFGALVALYSGMSSTYSIQGGNSQIFEKMAHSSTDLLELNSKVIKIIKSDSPSTSRRFIIERTNSRNVSITDAFDRVVIAVPNVRVAGDGW